MDNNNVDVVVVGAGMAGASVAAHLASRCTVLLLEKEPMPGMHATGRSAASYIPSYRGLDPSLCALTQASRHFLESPPTGFSEHSLLKQRGLLTLFGQAPWAASEQQRSALNEVLQSPIEVLDGEQVRHRLPELSQQWVGPAWWEPDVHDIDVNALHHGYLRLFQRRGGVIETSKDVSASFANGLWRVEAEGLSVSTPTVVNAAGAWADQFAAQCGVAPLGLTPKRRTAILIDPPANCNISSWPLVLAHDESFYFKPDAGLLLVSPADEHPSVPCDAQPEEIDKAYAADFAMQALDGLNLTKIPHSWAGLRTFAPDGRPVVGFDAISPGFFWCAGQGGHGIQIAPAVAELAAELIAGSPSISSINNVPFDPEWVSPARFTVTNNKTMAMPI